MYCIVWYPNAIVLLFYLGCMCKHITLQLWEGNVFKGVCHSIQGVCGYVFSDNHQVSLAGGGYVSSDDHQVSLAVVGYSRGGCGWGG